MNYTSLESALIAWVADLTGVASKWISFRDRASVRHEGTSIRLSWVSRVKLAPIDDVRVIDNAAAIPAMNLEVVHTGPRRLVLQVAAETYSQDPASHAPSLLSRLQDRAAFASSRAALKAANLGLVEIGGLTEANYTDPNIDRVVYRALVEVTLNAMSFESDDATNSIDSAEVTQTYTDVDGSTVTAYTTTEFIP